MSDPDTWNPHPQCIKCGEYRSRWKLLLLEATVMGDPTRTWIGNPFVLELECERCGYEWTMHTKDYIDVRS